MRTKNIIAALCLLATAAITNSCSKDGGYGSSGTVETTSNNVVSIQAMQFLPAALTVKEGSTVTWRNTDTEIHTVTSDDGVSFNSGNISSQGSYTIAAPAAGVYPYHCSLHPSMKGTLYVAVMGN